MSTDAIPRSLVRCDLATIKFLAAIINSHRPICPGMKRKTAHIDIRVEPALIDRIDAWRNQHRLPPTRSAAIVHMIEDFLERDPPPSDPLWKRFLNSRA